MSTPLRTKPGLVAGALIVIGFIVAVTWPAGSGYGLIAALVGALTVFVWWLVFSRARWWERLGALVVVAAMWFGTRPLLDSSIVGGGMGYLPVLAFPVLAAGLGISVWATRHASDGARRVAIVAALLAACVFTTLVRTAGVGGGGVFEFHWRWTPTPEERLLAQGNDDPEPPTGAAAPAPAPASPEPVSAATANASAAPTAPAPRKPADWPGFRGSNRDGAVHDVRIDTDWTKTPPTELWRQPIGPGWSSFAVDGDLVFTQEQRGDDEIVAAYRLRTGKPVWRHRDAVRFYESNGGPGPRGTPSVVNGRVYAFGATGLLNALDAGTGAVLWSRDVAADSKVTVPDWGFSSSPLVVGDLIVVAAGGTAAAYDATTGMRRWLGPAGGFSYSSPHLIEVGGVLQVVLLNGRGAIALAPGDGAVLWQHERPGGSIVQPAMADGQLLISAMGGAGGAGIRSLGIARAGDGWTASARWTSTGLKPYFNDFVVHRGHAFGFDGSILSCIDLADGKRLWKGGRYGSGQLVLLADQDLLLVLSDEGDLALVSATPDGFKELGRFKAIDGKTWNHPVVVRDIVVVRNGEEMASFRLTPAQ